MLQALPAAVLADGCAVLFLPQSVCRFRNKLSRHVELFGGGTGGSNYDTPPCVPCSEPEPDKKSSIYAVLAHFCVFCKKNPPCNCQIDKTGGNFL